MTKPSKELEVASVEHLENAGKGLVFSLRLVDHASGIPNIPAFAVRYQDQIKVYKNICGHIAVNLDFVEGQFFDEEGEHLVCSTHGALYQAGTGKCMGGPCYGVGLEPIDAIEKQGTLFITDENVESILL